MPIGFKPLGGLPRVGATTDATPRKIWRGGEPMYLPFGRIIDGTKSRDVGNTPQNILRCATLMGKVTSGGKYANAFLGATNGAYTSGTSLTVTAAVGLEIVRRIGTSGTFKIIGPATAGGPVQIETVTYSGVSGTTVTVTALANQYVTGSFIADTDGSHLPVTFIDAPWGVDVYDNTGTAQDQPFERFPVGGIVDPTQFTQWPADSALKQWVIDCLNDASSNFVFDSKY